MILRRFSVLQGLFGRFDGNRTAKEVAADMGRRWQGAASRNPKLREDLLLLGGVFVQPPVNMADGQMPTPAHKTEYQCGRDDGRKELATQLLALMGLTPEDLNQLLEDDDYAD